MIQKKLILLFAVLSPIVLSASKIPATIYLRDGSYTVATDIVDPSGVAFGFYEDSYESIGWDTLSLSTNQDSTTYTDNEKAYGLGYLEGVLTHDRIYNLHANIYKLRFYYEDNRKMPQFMIDFFEKQRNWVRMSYLSNKNDSYWQNVWALQQQLEGMIDGYNSMVSLEKQFSYAEFHTTASMDGDLGDIFNVDPNHRPKYDELTADKILNLMDSKMHCSALIKLTANYSDVYFGHNTWTNYVNMIRIFKEYSIVFTSNSNKANVVTFSSYPGTLGSIDDFYVTSAKLAVIETTNPVFETSLYDKIIPESLLYWQRVQISNRMTDNGKDWVEIFSKFNSGTYNNQNMVLDLKKIDSVNGIVHDNTLWIAEQIPGTIMSEDVTHILRYGYWPSYNVPYFEEIRRISGVDKYVSLHPELRKAYDYNHCVRANIFRRDQGKIQSYEDFKKLFRYNDYLHDPLSLNDPKMSIASRNDLNLTVLNCTGAIDAKTSSLKKVLSDDNGVSISIIAGPTNDYLPSFEWKKANCIKDPSYQWFGMPEVFDFQWEEFQCKFF